MERLELERWLTHHPNLVHTDARALLDECEKKARDHAYRDAWTHAEKIAEKSLRRFESGFIGHPASDTFVTREVCQEIARELKKNEPILDDSETELWIRELMLESLDPEAKEMFFTWLKDLTGTEEHATWLSIVRYTHRIARDLIHEEHMTNECDWDLNHTYAIVAARVVKILIGRFHGHAAGRDEDPASGLRVH
jgi:hypothetical protein